MIAAMPANLIVGAANVADARRVRADGSSRTATVREIGETSGDAFDPVVTNAEQMNAAIEADENLHRGMWAMGIRDGLKPPPEQFRAAPDADPPWDPQPKLVLHEDGTGHYETPLPDDKWLGTQGPRGESRTGGRPNTRRRSPE